MLLRMTDINKFYNGNQVLSHVSRWKTTTASGLWA